MGVLAWLVVKRGLTSSTALAAFLITGQLGAIIMGMRVDFYRYHLPVVLGMTILCGLGFQVIWQYFANRGGAALWNLVPGLAVDPAGRTRLASRDAAQAETSETGSETSVQHPMQSGTP